MNPEYQQALNRAAAAEPAGELGRAISAGGRDVVQPLFESLIESVARGKETDIQKLTSMFLALLVGDLQIKRVIGVCPKPTGAEIEDRVVMVLEAFVKLLAHP